MAIICNFMRYVWVITIAIINLSTHAQFTMEADHYWPMNTVINDHVNDSGTASIKWNVYVQGKIYMNLYKDFSY